MAARFMSPAHGAVESHVPPLQGCWMTNKHRTFVSSSLALRPGDRIQHGKLVKQASRSGDRHGGKSTSYLEAEHWND